MSVVHITIGSPEYNIIQGYRKQLDRIYLRAERSLAGSSPRSKERALAADIFEILGAGFSYSEAAGAEFNLPAVSVGGERLSGDFPAELRSRDTESRKEN